MNIIKRILSKISSIINKRKTKHICRKHNITYCNNIRISKDIKVTGNTKLVLSEGCWISHHCSFWGGGTITLGKNTHIGSFSSIFSSDEGGVIIGSDVNCARNMFIIDSNHCYEDKNTLIRLQPLRSAPIIIGNNVWIGANVTIIMGATIGNGCVIGACSLVNKAIKDDEVAVGVPARVVKKRF